MLPPSLVVSPSWLLALVLTSPLAALLGHCHYHQLLLVFLLLLHIKSCHSSFKNPLKAPSGGRAQFTLSNERMKDSRTKLLFLHCQVVHFAQLTDYLSLCLRSLPVLDFWLLLVNSTEVSRHPYPHTNLLLHLCFISPSNQYSSLLPKLAHPFPTTPIHPVIWRVL